MAMDINEFGHTNNPKYAKAILAYHGALLADGWIRRAVLYQLHSYRKA